MATAENGDSGWLSVLIEDVLLGVGCLRRFGKKSLRLDEKGGLVIEGFVIRYVRGVERRLWEIGMGAYGWVV